MNNLCHVVNDPIEGVLVDVLQGLATVELLQVAELHLHLLLFLQGKNKIRFATIVKDILGLLFQIIEKVSDKNQICQALVTLTAAACASQSVNSFFIIALLPTIRALERKAL